MLASPFWSSTWPIKLRQLGVIVTFFMPLWGLLCSSTLYKLSCCTKNFIASLERCLSPHILLHRLGGFPGIIVALRVGEHRAGNDKLESHRERSRALSHRCFLLIHMIDLLFIDDILEFQDGWFPSSMRISSPNETGTTKSTSFQFIHCPLPKTILE